MTSCVTPNRSKVLASRALRGQRKGKKRQAHVDVAAPAAKRSKGTVPGAVSCARPATPARTSFNDLPPELVESVFAHLSDSRDLARAACVSKACNKAADASWLSLAKRLPPHQFDARLPGTARGSVLLQQGVVPANHVLQQVGEIDVGGDVGGRAFCIRGGLIVASHNLNRSEQPTERIPQVAVYDFASHQRLGTLAGFAAAVERVSTDGQVIATGGRDGKVQLWDAKTLTELPQSPRVPQPPKGRQVELLHVENGRLSVGWDNEYVAYACDLASPDKGTWTYHGACHTLDVQGDLMVVRARPPQIWNLRLGTMLREVGQANESPNVARFWGGQVAWGKNCLRARPIDDAAETHLMALELWTGPTAKLKEDPATCSLYIERCGGILAIAPSHTHNLAMWGQNRDRTWRPIHGHEGNEVRASHARIVNDLIVTYTRQHIRFWRFAPQQTST